MLTVLFFIVILIMATGLTLLLFYNFWEILSIKIWKRSESEVISLGEAASKLLPAVISLAFIIYIFANFYHMTGIVSSDGSIVKDYKTCLYFSVVTFTSLGYGDFHPTEQARLAAASEVILGYVLLGVIIGTIVYILPRIGKKATKAEQKQ